MRRGLLFLLAGLTIFIIYLYFFVGMGELAEAAGRTDLLYYSMAVAALFLSAAFYSLAWQSILELLQIKSGFRKTFSFIWVGNFVDLMIPAESFSGELSKIYLMSKNSGEDMGRVAASVVSHRILTMATTLVCVVVGSIFLFSWYGASELVLNLMLFVAICTIVALFLICYLSLKPRITKRIAAMIVRFLSSISRGRWELTQFRTELERSLSTFHLGMRVLNEKRRSLLAPFGYSIIAFLLDLSVFYLVLLSLRFPASMSLVLIVYTIVSAIQTIPLGIPGEVGITEVAMINLYSLLGIPPGISGIATILTRVLTVWLRILIGYMVVQWTGITILRSLKSKPGGSKT